MALYYKIVIQRLKINDTEVTLLEHDNKSGHLKFIPSNIPDDNDSGYFAYLLDIHYYSGNTVLKQGIFKSSEIKEEILIKENLHFSDIAIEVVSPPEDKRDVKNLSTGAVAGALVAGPIGAAAGAWMGTKVKNVDLKISIPKLNIKILGKVASGFIPAYEKAQTASTINNDF